MSRIRDPVARPMELDQNGLRQQLERIPGLDVEVGLSTTGGRLESLARLLKKYEASHGDDGPLLERHWASGDLASAHRVAHSARSAAGFLGLLGVQEKAAALEAAFLDRFEAKDLVPLIAAFTRENEALCAAIRAACDPSGVPGS